MYIVSIIYHIHKSCIKYRRSRLHLDYYISYLEAVVVVPDVLLVDGQHRQQHVEQVACNVYTGL